MRKDCKEVRREPCGCAGQKPARQMMQPVQRPSGGNSEETSLAEQNRVGRVTEARSQSRWGTDDVGPCRPWEGHYLLL